MKCNKSEFSRFDRAIAAAEAEELRRLNASEDLMEAYFDERQRQRLSKMQISEMSFQDINILEDLKKSQVEDEFHDPNLSNPPPEDMQKEIFKMVDQCQIAASKNRPDLLNDFAKLRKMLEKSNLGISNTEEESQNREEEEIADQDPVSVSKSAGFKICKATRTVSGYASCSNVDIAGDRITAEALQNMMPAFMARGGVLAYGHLNGSVGKVLEWKMVNLKGNPAIYIKAKIFDDYATDNAIWRDIVSGKINAFSIGGIGYKHSQKCTTNDGCYREIPQIDLLEISLCDNPLNPEAKIIEVK